VKALADHPTKHGIKASVSVNTRLVTHLDISEQQIQKVIKTFKLFFPSNQLIEPSNTQLNNNE